MATNDDTLNVFFDVINGTNLSGTNVGTTDYQSPTYLKNNVFCGNEVPLPYPCIGITDHGPQFAGSVAVEILLKQLFKCFSAFVLLPQVSKVGAPVVPSERLYSPQGASNVMISIQTVMHGTHISKWFADGTAPLSPPLSDIQPDGLHVMEIPVSAVFTFHTNHKIKQLSLYLDRYKMQQQLTPAHAVSTGSFVSALQHYLEKEPSRH